ncbi:MAG: pyruvate kinase [Rhodospirillales bacterium]|jgi:pyruvate kinase|nr:pyruvate kinase [Rhodospirillales bacterium]MBT4039463.1 pyruvate kinase [Rhodospirillales bacterium]MBT4627101.1 pyruvate kinase [Rhodospirillales bacterium]MBT5352403.1 pyruvate kinase [Rhodospirillales bacterium]MBT5520417.1 pyruvate kinase [Rhodospirillales bacterium]
MRRQRKAKIIATLGPASSTIEMMAKLFEAGADVFRLNFSHGTHEDHKKRYDDIRELEKRYGRPIGVIGDLQGPKFRVGEFAGDGIELEVGQTFQVDLSEEPGDQTRVQLPHPEVFKALSDGTDLLLNDGRIRLKVKEFSDSHAVTEVIAGGPLSDNKGLNLPDAVIDVSPLTEKDREDLRFALDLGVDWIALSFVQRPEDVEEGRKLVAGRAGIMVKLEKPSAIKHLDEIIELSDSLMVARGDLGVECLPEDVPAFQKLIIRSCRLAGKPVIVATQMLESMIDAPTPTRAEASDVATAVYEGADTVMLSAESAAGDFPVEAVTMMDRIIRRVERDPIFEEMMEAQRQDPESTAADAITSAARQCASTISAAAIVTFTSTGSTTLRAARERPEVPIICCTPRTGTARRLALVWGVHCVFTEDASSFREMVTKSIKIASEEEFASAGDRLIITAGVPFGTPGATNILRIAWVE